MTGDRESKAAAEQLVRAVSFGLKTRAIHGVMERLDGMFRRRTGCVDGDRRLECRAVRRLLEGICRVVADSEKAQELKSLREELDGLEELLADRKIPR